MKGYKELEENVVVGLLFFLGGERKEQKIIRLI